MKKSYKYCDYDNTKGEKMKVIDMHAHVWFASAEEDKKRLLKTIEKRDGSYTSDKLMDLLEESFLQENKYQEIDKKENIFYFSLFRLVLFGNNCYDTLGFQNISRSSFLRNI